MNFGFYGWSKKKCPVCNKKLRKLAMRKQNYCTAGHYRLYRDRETDRITRIELYFESLGVVITNYDPGKFSTTIYSKTVDDNSVLGMVPKNVASKHFDNLLSFRDIKRYSKLWIMT